MDITQKAKTILENINLFNNQPDSLKIKTKDIATKCSDSNYSISVKQEFFLNKAYDHIKPIIDKKLERSNELADMSLADRLWEENARDEWDEEIGPYKALSFTAYKEIISKYETIITNLKNKIHKIKTS